MNPSILPVTSVCLLFAAVTSSGNPLPLAVSFPLPRHLRSGRHGQLMVIRSHLDSYLAVPRARTDRVRNFACWSVKVGVERSWLYRGEAEENTATRSASGGATAYPTEGQCGDGCFSGVLFLIEVPAWKDQVGVGPIPARCLRSVRSRTQYQNPGSLPCFNAAELLRA